VPLLAGQALYAASAVEFLVKTRAPVEEGTGLRMMRVTLLCSRSPQPTSTGHPGWRINRGNRRPCWRKCFATPSAEPTRRNVSNTDPLCCTGTPEELDRELPAHLREFVAGQLALSNNLSQIQREREEAEKVAREELKKKQKTVGNGGVKGKTSETKPRTKRRSLRHRRSRR
jgi:PRTRC genetic system protein E